MRMKTIRISIEVWRAINSERMSPSETFDGVIRRKLKMTDAPNIPDDIMLSVSDEVYSKLEEMWEIDDSFDYIIGRLFNVTWHWL